MAGAARAPEECGLDAERLERIARWQEALVAGGHLPMAVTLVSRRGKVAFCRAVGWSDVEGKVPVREDDIFRLYSMTKPIVSVALCMLYEEGCFQLDDPVHYFLGPAWRKENMTVFSRWTDIKAAECETVPCERDITVRQILTHTAGLSHGFDPSGVGIPVDRLYAKRWRRPTAQTVGADDPSMLAAYCEGLAKMPLLFQPGAHWNYSCAPDVAGRLVEVLSGRGLDAFLRERLFEPLGMEDTGFDVPPEKAGRFVRLYGYAPAPEGAPAPAPGSWLTFPHVGSFRGLDPSLAPGLQHLGSARPKLLSGAGGLVGTVRDYSAFCGMLLAGGVAPSGRRLVGVKTLEYATSNHLPGGRGLLDMIMDPEVQYSETAAVGGGFGLGFSVVQSPVEAGLQGSPGSFAWGGMAGTAFWCDPAEDLHVVFFTQVVGLQPRNGLRAKLGSLVYGCIADRRLAAPGPSAAARARL